MRLKLGQELWITADGELVAPWVTSQGEPRRGATVPTPRVLEKGSYVELRVFKGTGDQRDDPEAVVPLPDGQVDPLDLQARLEELDRLHTEMYRAGPVGFTDEPLFYGKSFSELMKEDHAELLAEMGHTGQPDLQPRGFKVTDLCGCRCKGCGTGWHCHDHRCFPLG